MKLHEAKPTQGRGTRYEKCEKYNECLMLAAKNDWRDFNCTVCPLCASVSEEAFGRIENEGYDEIDENDLSLQKEEQKSKEVENLRKLFQRARDPDYLKQKKSAYVWRFNGCTDYIDNPFDEDQLNQLKTLPGLLGTEENPELLIRLQSAGRSYISSKKIYEEKPDFATSSQAIQYLTRALQMVIEGLEILDAEPTLYQAFQSRHPDVDTTGIEIRRLYYSAEEFSREVVEKNKQLANVPLIILLTELSDIYESVTDLKATGRGRRPDKMTVDKKVVPFLEFVHAFLKIIDHNTL